MFSYVWKCKWADETNDIVEINHYAGGKIVLTVWVNIKYNNVDVKRHQEDFVPESSRHLLLDRLEERSLERAKKFIQCKRPAYPENIRWHEDGMQFETLRESWEWADSVVSELWSLYDGYQTEDEKIAMALVYELTKLNAFDENPFRVYTCTEYRQLDKRSIYRVWIEKNE